jgi:hypothetical protein
MNILFSQCLKYLTLFEDNKEPSAEDETIFIALKVDNSGSSNSQRSDDKEPLEVNTITIIRICGSCDLLGAIIKSLAKNTTIRGRLNYDFLDKLIGAKAADDRMKELISSLDKIIGITKTDYQSTKLKMHSLWLIRTILTAHQDINQNLLIEFFKINLIYSTLLSIITNREQVLEIRCIAMTNLSLLCAYHSEEEGGSNEYWELIRTIESKEDIVQILMLMAIVFSVRDK